MFSTYLLARLPDAVPAVDPDAFRRPAVAVPAWHGAVGWGALVVVLVAVLVAAVWVARRRSIAVTVPSPALRRGVALIVGAAAVAGALLAVSAVLTDERVRAWHGDASEREEIAEHEALVAIQEHYGVNLVGVERAEAQLPAYGRDSRPVELVGARSDRSGDCEIVVRDAQYQVLCDGTELVPRADLAGVPQVLALEGTGSLTATHLLTVARHVTGAFAIAMVLVFTWLVLAARPRAIEADPELVALRRRAEAEAARLDREVERAVERAASEAEAELAVGRISMARLGELEQDLRTRVRALLRPYLRAVLGAGACLVLGGGALILAVWADDTYSLDPPWAYEVTVAEGVEADVAAYYARAPLDGFSADLVTRRAVTGSVWRHPAGTYRGADCFFTTRSGFVLVECETSPEPTLVGAPPG